MDTALRNAEREGIVRLYAVLSAESVTDDHPAQDYFRDRYDGLRAFVADALCEACELPADRAESAGNAANAIIAVMDGLQVQWLLAPDSVDMAASTDLVVTSLLATLAPNVSARPRQAEGRADALRRPGRRLRGGDRRPRAAVARCPRLLLQGREEPVVGGPGVGSGDRRER